MADPEHFRKLEVPLCKEASHSIWFQSVLRFQRRNRLNEMLTDDGQWRTKSDHNSTSTSLRLIELNRKETQKVRLLLETSSVATRDTVWHDDTV